MNQHYFDVPFAFSGDVTAIPDPLQTGGTVSFTEGWNYNYQRDLATDPAALPIDRSTMNWLLLQITAALQALQQQSVPEWITAAQNGGTAFSYGKGAVVLWSASGSAPFTKFVSLTTANTNTPSASDPTGATTGWQIVIDPISTSAQAAAGTDNASIMTPLLVAQQTALRALIAGSATQVFNVGPATSAMHAPEAAQVQQNAFNYGGLAGGTANALTATLVPAPGSYTDYLTVVVRVASNNTGSVSLNLNGQGIKPVIGAAHQLLQGGELIAGGFACFAYSTNYSEAILLWATGGGVQVGGATQSDHAVQFGQVSGVVGSMRNGSMGISTANTLATFNADEIIVETALGGLRYCLSNFSQSVNLAITGVGGMDTGSAPTSGYVAFYAIYNPASNSQALLAVNATSSAVGNVYGGAHMPTGYTASALVSVWPTDPSGKFKTGTQKDRSISFSAVLALSTSTSASSWTVFGTSSFPPNAVCASGTIEAISSTNSGMSLSIASDANGSGQQQISGFATAPYGLICPWTVFITQSQALYYQTTNSAGTPTFSITTTSYTF